MIGAVVAPVVLLSIALLEVLLLVDGVVVLVRLTLLDVWVFAGVVPLLRADVASVCVVPVLMLVGTDELTVVPEKGNTQLPNSPEDRSRMDPRHLPGIVVSMVVNAVVPFAARTRRKHSIA